MTERKKPTRKRAKKRKATKRKPPNSPRRGDTTRGADGLTDGERRFCAEFLKDFNGTQAAIRAGYAVKGAPTQATRMLKRANVAAAISRLASENEKKLDLSAERTLRELARIAFFDPREVVDWITHQVGTVDLPDPDDPEKCNTVELGHTQVTLKDAKDLSPDAAAAISEVSQTKEGMLKIKFHSKPQALNILARHHGLIIDRAQVDIRMIIGSMNAEQLDRYEYQLDERIRALGAQAHVEGTTVEVDERESARKLRAASKTI